MFKIVYTNRFDKEVLKCAKRGLNIDLLEKLVEDLRQTGTVPAKHLPHILSGKLQGYWECHIKADWLLIWLKDDTQITITLVRTGTHSDLF
jgi:mRNA interferase YafQ